MTKKILMVIIGLSVIVSAYVLLNRYKAEERNSNIEIAVDMTDFQDFSDEAGIDFKDMAQDLKNHGATSIAVQEITLRELRKRGHIAFMPLSDLMMGSYSTGIGVPAAEEIVSRYKNRINIREIYNYSIVITENKDIFDFLQKAFTDRIDKTDILQKDNTYAIIIQQKIKNIEDLGLGFYEKDLKYAKSLGFMNIIPRIQNYQGITEKSIDEKINQLKNPEYRVSTVIFAGDTVLGYDENKKSGFNNIQVDKSHTERLDYAAKRFKEKGLISAIIEVPAEKDIESVQRGITRFSQKSGYTSTKVYSAKINKQKTYYLKDIMDQWSRAILERNVRIIYVRPVFNPYKGAVDNFKDNLELVSTLTERIKKMGFQRGFIKGLGTVYPETYQRFIIFAGVMSGGILLLLSFIKLKDYIIYILIALGLFGLAGIFAASVFYNIIDTRMGDLMIKMTALGGAVIFPSLAGLYLINVYSKLSTEGEKPLTISIILKSIGVLLAASAISLIGGLAVAALLSESRYMLKLDIFRGVKLSFILPMAVFIILYIRKIGIYVDKDNNPINISLQFKKLLNTSVTIKYVLAGAVVIAGLAILILRSGNASAGLSSEFERSFRSFLETMLVSRPRSKELLAFPLLMLLVYASIKRYKIFSFLLMFAGTIGLIDIVNSFSHIRMPLGVAAMSTVYSLLFGILIGTILIILWIAIQNRYLKKHDGRREAQ